MKGKWAQGLQPRAFLWIVTDKLAACERPGGYARNHRKVRRDEELIWIAQQGFTHVLSLLDSPHNLSAYEEAGIAHRNLPLGRPGAEAETLPAIYETLLAWFRSPHEKVLLHHEEFGDRLCGVIGGFLLAADLLRGEPTAVTFTERLTRRQLGPDGRAIVRATIAAGLAPSTPPETLPDPILLAMRRVRDDSGSADAKPPASSPQPAAKKPAKKQAKKPAEKQAKKPVRKQAKKPVRKAAAKSAKKRPAAKSVAKKSATTPTKKPTKSQGTSAKKPTKRQSAAAKAKSAQAKAKTKAKAKK